MEDNIIADIIADAFVEIKSLWKILASWKSPTKSIAAMVAITLVWIYVKMTVHTSGNLALWLILISYVCLVIHKNVRSETRGYIENEEKLAESEESKEEVSMSEVSFLIEDTKTYYTILANLRQDSPGLFCLLLCPYFLLLGYFGSFIATSTLIYLSLIGAILMPLTLKQLKEKFPMISSSLSKLVAYLLATGGPTFRKYSVRVEDRSKEVLELAQAYIRKTSNSYKHWIRSKRNKRLETIENEVFQ